MTADTIEKDATWTTAFTYLILGNVTVKGTDGADSITTLTIEPGVEVRMTRYRQFTVGYSSGDPGALVAQGTSADPIVFTSNEASPAAGDWYYIKFDNTSDDTTSTLEYCTVEYGGYGSQGAVNLTNAKPSIRHCTIRKNIDKGIYISGAGCNGTEIKFNSISENAYGIYIAGGAQPVIEFNNFCNNSAYALFNASTTAVTANNNWWCTDQGPYQSGNGANTNVEVETWLDQAYDGTLPENTAPVAVNDAAVMDEDTSVVIQVLANDSDADGDSLTVSAVSEATSGAVINNMNGSLTYTPSSNFNGEDSFSYAVSDGIVSISAGVTIVVNPVNDPPAAVAGTDQSVMLNDLVTLYGQGSTDPDGDALTYNWSLISRPVGSKAAFAGSGSMNPQFTADTAGTYQAQLALSDGSVTATDSVMITVSGPPSASLTADPPVISQGDTVTLSWQTASAATVRIDPDIGEVAASGSVTVTPTSVTTYVLSATGPTGTGTAEALVTIDTPFVLQIDAPLDQQTIDRPGVLVRGMVMNSTGRETGVTVNGVAALQYDEQFMVNHVPLVQGENTLTITATDTAGEVYSAQLTVFADMSGQYCKTTALPEMGLAPFKGELQIASPVELYRRTVLDFGPSDVVFGAGPPGLLPITIKQPGLYWFEVEAKSIDNQIFTDEVGVLVYDTDELDALLQAKWNAMKTCLLAGDVNGALSHFSRATRDEFEAIFTSLGNQLPQIAQQMQDIELIQSDEGFAKYHIMKDEIIEGETHTITYDIYFSTDENGIWKIDRF